jgi:hypothetical protein
MSADVHSACTLLYTEEDRHKQKEVHEMSSRWKTWHLKWPPVVCKLYPRDRQSHANFRRFYSCYLRLAATRVQLRLAVSRMQNLHALAQVACKAASFLQARDTCACKCLSINTMHGLIQSRETVPLNIHAQKT